MKIKAAVFDWDGVLYDIAPSGFAKFNIVLVEFGMPTMTFENLRDISAPTVKESFERAGLSAEDALRARDRFAALHESEPPPSVFPDVPDTFRWLHERSVNIYVVTVRDETNIRALLEKHLLMPFVNGIRGDARPETRMAFLSQLPIDLGIAKDEMVFVDDSADMLEMARAIGCYRVGSARGLSSYARLAATQPDAIIHTLFAFQRYLNLWNGKNPPAPHNT